MGWSWAPFLANGALSSLLATIHGDGFADRMATYGLPVPQMAAGATREEVLRQAVAFGYIDDFGLLVAGPPRVAADVATLWSEATASGMRARGLAVHKVQVSEGLPGALGATIRGRPYVLHVQREKAVRLRVATLHLLSLPQVRGNYVERLLGMWSWAPCWRGRAWQCWTPSTPS